MSERRLDPYTGRSILIAPGRRGLGGVRRGGLPEPEGRCPFCPGHEADTEPSVATWPPEGDWQVRVVKNKFPLVRYDDTEVRGEHEVGIDARAHDLDWPDLEASHLAAMLTVYRDRCRALEAQDGIEALVLFRNRGRRAGSSQPHPHTQIVALAHVPEEIALRERRARAFFETHGESLHDHELRRELASERLLAADSHGVLTTPRVPSRPYELRILPRRASASFSDTDQAGLRSLAEHLRDATLRLRRAGITDLNVLLRQPPTGARGPAYAWHIELLPRTGGDAGYELATGEMIVVVSPEEAARALALP